MREYRATLALAAAAFALAKLTHGVLGWIWLFIAVTYAVEYAVYTVVVPLWTRMHSRAARRG